MLLERHFPLTALTAVVHRAPAGNRLVSGQAATLAGMTFNQLGLATTAQLLAGGHTVANIRANLKAGRWTRVLHGVYAMFTGPLWREARLVAALLYAGQPAVLSHQTAAEEWHVVPIDEEGPVHVTVPYTCSAVSRPPFVVVHRSRAYWHIATELVGMPRTALADTIIDVAVEEPTAGDATTTFVHLAGASRMHAEILADRLERRPPRRYFTTLHRALALVTGGALSALECEYAVAVEASHSLPEARRQTPFSVDGKRLWEDATYDHLGVALTVRLDGRQYHATPGIAFRDRRRDNVAELAGRARLTYGWHDVHNDPCGVAAEVATVLAREGWRGQLSPCSRCSGAASGNCG